MHIATLNKEKESILNLLMMVGKNISHYGALRVMVLKVSIIFLVIVVLVPTLKRDGP